MNPDRPTALLGGLSPALFMRRHWQKKPLLVRSAVPEGLPELDARSLFALAASDDVESRLVVRDALGAWSVRQGPLPRRALPPIARAGWSLLVQGVDAHVDAAHRLLARFRFVPDFRLDDLMVSFASDGGGVGPHVDSYDVFLLQLSGRRRWRIGRPARAPRLRVDVPLKMLADFMPTEDWLLEPGDMLYLPPGWGHDGIAEGPCLTASIGFRAPDAELLASDLLERLADADRGDEPAQASEPRLYRDRHEAATRHPARVPPALQRFADRSVERLLADRQARARALGESLSELKAGVFFEAAAEVDAASGVVLDRRTRMLYDDRHVFINGESYRASGGDAARMRTLADRRSLDADALAGLSDEATELLAQWVAAGWCRAATDTPESSPDPSSKQPRHSR
ncbi:MAG: cupin domain-containing protein [Caldimonas sp.]